MTRSHALLAAAVLIGGSLMPGLVGAARALEAPPGPPLAVLRERPPVAPGVASFPLVEGSGPAAQRINQNLAAAEQALRRDVAACRAGGWSRTVAVTSNGPRFLSLLVDDAFSCGGAYPNADRSALVYDLRSGEPVAWQSLLPARFAVRVPGPWMPAAGPGARVDAWPLLKVYRQHYPAQVPGIDPSAWDTCRESVENGFALWPDTAAQALVIQPMPRNQAAASCAVPVALTVPALRELGVPSALLEGLGAR